jgi:uncharacterized membrane protein YkvA (DUF1232 family)
VDNTSLGALASPPPMSESSKYLTIFPQWLKTLGSDAQELAQLLTNEDLPEGVRRLVAGGVNYLFKSLDLIPDGIEDLGYLDDAFVLRVSALLALTQYQVTDNSSRETLSRLAKESEHISAFLGENYARLETYVKALGKGAARGRTVDEILESKDICTELQNEVAAFTKSYQAPSFTRDEKTLVKLRSFLDTKLPT